MNHPGETIPIPRVDPDSGLTPEQVERLRKRLLDERSEISAQYERHRDEGRLASVAEGAEPEEAAQRTSEQSISTDLAELQRAQLREIDRAIRKLENGTYGVSEESGEPIGFARLDALPWARYSAEDQERMEKQLRRR